MVEVSRHIQWGLLVQTQAGGEIARALAMHISLTAFVPIGREQAVISYSHRV